MYAVVFLDAIIVKVRDNHVVANKPAYLAVGIHAEGDKHVLGIWLAKTDPHTATAGEGARFWASVTADLRNRGVNDILIACCDGLSGFEDAVHAAFPHATVQTCVVHLIRNALRPVPCEYHSAMAAEMKKIYTAQAAARTAGSRCIVMAFSVGQEAPPAGICGRPANMLRPGT